MEWLLIFLLALVLFIKVALCYYIGKWMFFTVLKLIQEVKP
jgi:hypothetical protein